MASVFVFSGLIYRASPGREYRPHQVCIDFGRPRKPKTSQWRAIESWLVANGYRLLWRSPTRGFVTQCKWAWGLVSVFGDNTEWADIHAIRKYLNDQEA